LALAQAKVATMPVRVELPMLTGQPERKVLKPAQPSDDYFNREEVRRRVADFKAIQRRFELAREEYYRDTMFGA
jgi:hypothetical protein